MNTRGSEDQLGAAHRRIRELEAALAKRDALFYGPSSTTTAAAVAAAAAASIAAAADIALAPAPAADAAGRCQRATTSTRR